MGSLASEGIGLHVVSLDRSLDLAVAGVSKRGHELEQ